MGEIGDLHIVLRAQNIVTLSVTTYEFPVMIYDRGLTHSAPFYFLYTAHSLATPDIVDSLSYC